MCSQKGETALTAQPYWILLPQGCDFEIPNLAGSFEFRIIVIFKLRKTSRILNPAINPTL